MLYPIAASKFYTTSLSVESAVRYAVEMAWDRGDRNTISAFFGYTVKNCKDKPTNSEFIAFMTDKIMQYLSIWLTDQNICERK